MKRSILILAVVAAIFLFSCDDNSLSVQKPRGYFKIDLPKKQYQLFDRPGYPYSFEYPVYGNVIQDSLFFEEKAENPYWINIDFPRFNSRIHISYKEIKRHSFDSLVEDAFKMS